MWSNIQTLGKMMLPLLDVSRWPKSFAGNLPLLVRPVYLTCQDMGAQLTQIHQQVSSNCLLYMNRCDRLFSTNFDIIFTRHSPWQNMQPLPYGPVAKRHGRSNTSLNQCQTCFYINKLTILFWHANFIGTSRCTSNLLNIFFPLYESHWRHSTWR